MGPQFLSPALVSCYFGTDRCAWRDQESEALMFYQRQLGSHPFVSLLECVRACVWECVCVHVFRCWFRGGGRMQRGGCPLRTLPGGRKGGGRQRGWVELRSAIGLDFGEVRGGWREEHNANERATDQLVCGRVQAHEGAVWGENKETGVIKFVSITFPLLSFQTLGGTLSRLLLSQVLERVYLHFCSVFVWEHLHC